MIYTYHKFHRFKRPDGSEVSLDTQQYEIGVYAIINRDPAMQFSTTPQAMVKTEKKLQKQLDSGELAELELTGEIKVKLVDGFWKEVQ